MEKEDLRIGDLVKYKDSICVVAGIGSDEHVTALPTFTVEPGVTYDIDCKEINQIPLTEDILHENGWEVVGDGAYRKGGLVECDFVSSGIRCYTIHSDKHQFVSYIESVSDLQHIMHDIGLNSVMALFPFEEREPVVVKSCKVFQIQSRNVIEPCKLMNYPEKIRCSELAVHYIAHAAINYKSNSYLDDISSMCSILNNTKIEQPVRMITQVNDTTFSPSMYYNGHSNGDVYIKNGNQYFVNTGDSWIEFENEKQAIHYIIHNSPAINPDLVVNLSDFE